MPLYTSQFMVKLCHYNFNNIRSFRSMKSCLIWLAEFQRIKYTSKKCNEMHCCCPPGKCNNEVNRVSCCRNPSCPKHKTCFKLTHTV